MLSIASVSFICFAPTRVAYCRSGRAFLTSFYGYFSLFFLCRHHIQIRGIDAACRIEDPPSEDTDSHQDDTNDVNDSLTADHRHEGGVGSGGYQSQGTGQSGGEGSGRGDAGGAGGSSSAALATPPRLVFLRLSVHLPETAGSCSDITDFLTDVSKRALWDADMESYAIHKTLLHAAPESDAVVRMTRKKFDDRPSVRSRTRSAALLRTCEHVCVRSMVEAM